MVHAELIGDPAALEPHTGAWDELAVASAKPYCSPAWMLAWWRHAAPPRARLGTIVVGDGDEIVAVAPLYAERTATGVVRYRFLGGGGSYRCEPVARPGTEGESAAAIAETLARAARPPDVIHFEGVPESSAWPRALADAWPGRPASLLHRTKSIAAPTVRLEGRTYDEWFAGKSREFRRDMRRNRKALDEMGATFRMSEDATRLDRDLPAFVVLHHARWAGRGGSKALDASVELMLAEAARHLLGSSRLRLWNLEVEGRAVASQVFLAAGGEVSAWLSGFDPEWSHYAPGLQLILEGIRHAFELGDSRLDLGGGDEPYKRRFADGDEALGWTALVPRGRRRALVRLEETPRAAYRAVANRVPKDVKQRIDRSVRGLLRRPKR